MDDLVEENPRPPLDLVDIVLEDDRWEDAGLPAMAERAARAVGDWLELGEFQVVVLGCDDARIAELNGAFRQKGTPTNVLSWPSEERGAEMPGLPPDLPDPGPPDDPEELGDIAIAYDTCAREAAEQGKPLDDHVTHLIVHALLHLLGYDHIEDDEAELMEATEIAVLARLGVSNPY